MNIKNDPITTIPFTPLETMHKFKDKLGYWEPYPGYDVEEWRNEVKNDNTRQGYWQWVEELIELQLRNT